MKGYQTLKKNGKIQNQVLKAFLGLSTAAAGYWLVRSQLAPPVKTIAIEQLDGPYEVCIVGSGFAGTILAKSLAEQGIRTVVLESGESLLRWFTSPVLKNLAGYETSGDTRYPTVRTRARAIGGNSNFWTGRCERYHPSDFEEHPYTPPGAPWPIRYADIEPYYERAEKTLRVGGGELSEYHPPRKNRLPLPAKVDISDLKAFMAEIGVVLDDSPTAMPRKDFRFFRLSKEILAGAAGMPDFDLVTGVTATRLLSKPDRSIDGVEVQTFQGEKRIVKARFYIVACGGIETPRLLLLSRSKEFPQGIGNLFDRVGRGFNEHTGVNFYARIPHRLSTIVPRHKIGRTHQFYDRFRAEGLGSVLPVVIQSWVFPHHLMKNSISEIPERMSLLAKRLRQAEIYIGATIEMKPVDSNRVTLSERQVDLFGNPLPHLHFSFSAEDRKLLDRTRSLISGMFERMEAQGVRESDLTWSRHHIGTCRMGDDPKTSVVDRNLRVHETPNLYLCGSEVFVTGAAVPPVLTIAALAHRLADHLTGCIRGKDGAEASNEDEQMISKEEALS